MEEETSRSHDVTITFGRSSNQVVKRAGLVRDRLEDSGDDSSQLASKRQRAVNDRPSQNSNNLNDIHLDKNDLRFKLMEKNVLRRFQSNDGRNGGMDLREKLSRAARDSLTSPSYPESIHGKRETRFTMPDPPRSSLTSPSFHERMPERRDTRYQVQDPRNYNVLGGVSSARLSDSLNRVDTLRSTYSPWTLESLRKRSPTIRSIGGTRNQSPSIIHEDMTKRPQTRAYEEDSRKATYTSKNFPALDPGRSVVTMTSEKPASASLPKISCMGNEHNSVENFLKSLGLEKYGITFKAEEIDIATLKQMEDNDLKDLGIPMGPRKKIMLALLPHTKRELL
ncbi:uncharacterized protein LOC124927754 [Impatiens glandulifera]|uniref:uncharacterized protein LOC124927754 n=1 Tax=Impatiens glandulifera TaxID=253017 RepID=UPI001FB0BDAB|nr:uncharacterized protein LOC124927754 [Impatiens glandulifera]